ncbi:MAG TPA: hypothetical protein VED67_06210 [Thermodesulfovibrionales bacterium]|nr:hypothetical protein [Thermodesulfovibrionales bacterium]
MRIVQTAVLCLNMVDPSFIGYIRIVAYKHYYDTKNRVAMILLI